MATLWVEHVNTLSEHKSFCFNNCLVREYQSVKYLSMSKQGEVFQIDDLGVVNKTCTDKDKYTRLTKCSAQWSTCTCKSCLKCKACVEPSTPPLGCCTKVNCSMLQQYDICADKLVPNYYSCMKMVNPK